MNKHKKNRNSQSAHTLIRYHIFTREFSKPNIYDYDTWCNVCFLGYFTKLKSCFIEWEWIWTPGMSVGVCYRVSVCLSFHRFCVSLHLLKTFTRFVFTHLIFNVEFLYWIYWYMFLFTTLQNSRIKTIISTHIWLPIRLHN